MTLKRVTICGQTPFPKQKCCKIKNKEYQKAIKKRKSDTKELSVSETAVKKRKLRRSSRVSGHEERLDSQSTETDSESEESSHEVKGKTGLCSIEYL